MIDMFALANIQVQNFKTDYYPWASKRVRNASTTAVRQKKCLKNAYAYQNGNARHMFGKESYGIGSAYRAYWKGDGKPTEAGMQMAS